MPGAVTRYSYREVPWGVVHQYALPSKHFMIFTDCDIRVCPQADAQRFNQHREVITCLRCLAI